MYYLIETYQRQDRNIDTSQPLKTIAVALPQLEGALVRILQHGSEVALVSRISEEVFTLFYQEKNLRRSISNGK